MGERVLVTGGAGYLGSLMCERLLAAGHRVTVLDRLVHGVPSLLHLCGRPGFEFVYGDVRERSTVAPLVRRADVLIPLAGVVGAPACDREPRRAVSVNFTAVRMLNRLRGDQQLLVFPATNSGYGTRSGDVYCTEETPLEPISLYGRTKVDAEAEVLSRPRTLSFRLSTAFGVSPRMRTDLMVNHFVWSAVNEGRLVMYEKDFKRGFVHARDIADCFVFGIEHADRLQGRPYNLGLDAANLSKEELALCVRRHVPGFEIEFAPCGHDPDQRNYVVSNQRLREAGFEARRSLDDGIRELIAGYRMLARPETPAPVHRNGNGLSPAAIGVAGLHAAV